MPFDPHIPINDTIVDADELRTQFNALNEQDAALEARLDTIPAGPEGPAGANGADGNEGPPGPPFASAVVDAVTMLEPGSAATVES